MANTDSQGAMRVTVGQQEEAGEPVINGVSVMSSSKKDNSARKSQPTSQPTPASVATRALRKPSSGNFNPSIASPPTQSPHSSRNTSPIRQGRTSTVSGTLSTQPSATAIQRALSASNIPNLQPQGSAVLEGAVSSKLPSKGNDQNTTGLGDSTPQWPISPRLKSPPPSALSSRRTSAAVQKKSDAPSIQVLSATPRNNSPATSTPKQASGDGARPEQPQSLQAQSHPPPPPPPPTKSSTRGGGGKSTLETVQENSSDTQEPSPAAIQAAADLKPLTKITDDDGASSSRDSPTNVDQKHTQPGESGSESAGNKSDTNPRGRPKTESKSPNDNQTPRPRNASKNTYASTTSRTGDGKPNMTVETETVQSIPQSGLAPASENANRLRADNGSVKLKPKPSSETIRPKKERKRTERKARSVNQGSATSKADLFEARVANYVDEANTSDSDEAFVYESNPPEQQRRQRHHSRTPSVTSSHSIAEQQRGPIRNFGDTLDGPRIGGKRSMKFSSNPYNDVENPENNNGAPRTHTPRHIGRFGRGGNHSATHDQPDSPYTQASRVRQNHNQRSRPNSPKSTQSMPLRGSLFSSNRKQEQPFDFDPEQNADDERTPLVGTVRGPRNRSGRRFGASSVHSMHSHPEDRRSRSCFSGRMGSCILTGLVVLLVLISAVGFVVASNRTLYDVQIKQVKNVLVSQEELILDLVVGAVNPNALSVTISDNELDIFAKSRHLSTPNVTRARSIRATTRRSLNASPETSQPAQTMLLGRIFHFDQGLAFDASPIKQREHVSSGQIRLMRPGNDTEAGGSAHWKEIIQNEFELVVRGVLKYQLPMSSRFQRVEVGASVKVIPEDGIDENGNMHVEPIDHSEHWQWIDWPDVTEDDGNDDDDNSAQRSGMMEVD